MTLVVGQINRKADSESQIYLHEGSWEQHTRGSAESRLWRERLNYNKYTEASAYSPGECKARWLFRVVTEVRHWRESEYHNIDHSLEENFPRTEI